MAPTRILIVGAGGFARAVLEAVDAAGGVEMCGWVDDQWPKLRTVDGRPVVGPTAHLAELRAVATTLVVAIGDNRARERLHAEALSLGFTVRAVVHPQAVIAPSVRLGAGAIVMAGATLGSRVQVGPGAIVNFGATLDHDVELGAFACVGAGACAGGGSAVGHRACLHDGAVLPRASRLDDDGQRWPVPTTKVRTT